MLLVMGSWYTCEDNAYQRKIKKEFQVAIKETDAKFHLFLKLALKRLINAQLRLQNLSTRNASNTSPCPSDLYSTK